MRRCVRLMCKAVCEVVCGAASHLAVCTACPARGGMTGFLAGSAVCNANSRTDARPEPPIASAPGVRFGADCEDLMLPEIAPEREMQ